MRRLLWPCAFAFAALLGGLWMWGFTVDDALISIRYAHELVTGAGYRFNPDGPSTDGVTPLPWPFVIAAVAGAPPLVALVRVKVIDLVLSCAAAAVLGLASPTGPPQAGRRKHEQATTRARLVTLVLLVVCLPFDAYAASGMETPLAVLLATLAVWTAARPKGSLPYAFAGLAAAVRPEMLPWAVALSCGVALVRRDKAPRVVLAVLVASAPFAVCAMVRAVAFGRVAPLAVYAKPSDLSHGLVYVAGALLATAVPVLLVARPTTPLAAVVTAAFGMHVLAVIAAGGDSMPYARLFVPLVPTVLLVHLDPARPQALWWWVRSAAAFALGVYVVVVAGPRGRHVMADRADLVARARPLLSQAKRVAAVDIGWVSASTDAHIVDLAGLTDPEIAALPGGHTSKRISGAMLLDRDVDMLVLYNAHVVTERLSRDPVVRSHYELAAELPGYVVLARH